MVLMIVCGVLFLAGTAAGVVWSSVSPLPPTRPVSPEGTAPDVEEDDNTPVLVLRRFVWSAAVVIVTGVTAGIAVIGGGGRLAMRLLAVTAGDDAQGRVTEAHEVVGEITTGGTVGFVAFIGVFGGLIVAALWMLARRFLPGGPLGGVVFGLGLLVVLGPTMDPIRRNNEDFDIVGPGWVAVITFTVLAVAVGLAMQGIAARLGNWLPLPAKNKQVLLRYALPAVVAAFAFSATGAMLVLAGVVITITRWRPLVDAVRSHRFLVAGRVALGVLTVAFLPNAVLSVIDIATR